MLVSFLLALAALAAPAAAAPAHLARSNNNVGIQWRKLANEPTPEAQAALLVCPSGAMYQVQNGDKPSLSAGTPIQYKYCIQSWQHIDKSGTPGPITIAQNKCLDSGLDPTNGARPHAWDCIPGAPQQQWRVRCDGLLELTGYEVDGKRLCLDVVDGNRSLGVQMWECDSDNVNQQWNLGTGYD